MLEETMIILALDTSLGPCSVALWRDKEIIRESIENVPGQQSKTLIPMIEAALAAENLAYSDCTAIACVIGPGGFTGIRTGLAAARAIALACNIPLIGLSSLKIMASCVKNHAEFMVVIDAHRDEWYAQHYTTTPTLTALSEPTLIDTATRQAITIPVIDIPFSACDVARLAAVKYNHGERIFPINPLYIRKPDAKLPSQLPPTILGKTS